MSYMGGIVARRPHIPLQFPAKGTGAPFESLSMEGTKSPLARWDEKKYHSSSRENCE